MKTSEICCLLIGILLGAVCIGLMVSASTTNTYRQQAIDRGYAEYVMNPTNGVTTWRWKQ